MKDRRFKVLRNVSPAHRILPKSYGLADVTLSDRNAYASGGSTNIWKGQLDGRQVCIKAFRTLPTSGPEVWVELVREHRTPPKEAKKEKGCKEFGVWFKHFFFWQNALLTS